MITRETLYCFGCGKFISRDNAYKTFRTGYYRVIYPLAFCLDCAKREQVKEQDMYDPEQLPVIDQSSATMQELWF
jgi:hypothetical protein